MHLAEKAHRDLKGNVLVISLLFLDFPPPADALLGPSVVFFRALIR